MVAQASLDEKRRKTMDYFELPKIELGAVLNATCTKCGGKGLHACILLLVGSPPLQGTLRRAATRPAARSTSCCLKTSAVSTVHEAGRCMCM